MPERQRAPAIAASAYHWWPPAPTPMTDRPEDAFALYDGALGRNGLLARIRERGLKG